MADFSQQLAALQAGLASGEARIESDGDVIWYRGVADILKAIDYFTRLQAAANTVPGATRPATTLAYYDPGLDRCS